MIGLWLVSFKQVNVDMLQNEKYFKSLSKLLVNNSLINLLKSLSKHGKDQLYKKKIVYIFCEH